MTVPLQIVRLRAVHADALAQLFDAIAADASSSLFHPHAFDRSEAQRVCSLTGRDLYFALEVAGRFEGYGMLRGWDEGFSIPSLGIYVAPSLRGSGAARLLMQHMHVAARLAGAPSIRLKVYPDNTAAVRLYRSLGYAFDGEPDPSGQWIGRLALAGS